MPLSEAITTEIPKVVSHRPFDPDNFVTAVDREGVRVLCLACCRLSDDAYTTVGKHDTWAQRHWVEKHT